ncbi:hypothetical protein Tco_0611692 [Tanacetum coccineum]
MGAAPETYRRVAVRFSLFRLVPGFGQNWQVVRKSVYTSNCFRVRVVKTHRAEDEPKLLDTTVGRVVPLLPVAPARGESELEDSVDKLFDDGGSDDQAEKGDSAGGGQGVGIQFVSEAAEVVAEDVFAAPAIATITTVTATVDAATVAKEAPIKPSLFGAGSSSAGGTDSAPGGFFDVSW